MHQVNFAGIPSGVWLSITTVCLYLTLNQPSFIHMKLTIHKGPHISHAFLNDSHGGRFIFGMNKLTHSPASSSLSAEMIPPHSIKDREVFPHIVVQLGMTKREQSRSA